MSHWNPLVAPIGGRRLVVALGGLYVAIAVGWTYGLIREGTPFGSVLLMFVLIGGPGLVLLYGGYRLPQADIRSECTVTIAGRCLDALAVMSAILALYHVQPADSLAGSFQTVLILTSLSTVAGFGIGVHDARAKTRAYELEERNRELQETQAELEQTVAQLRSSNERLEQFAYAASHDLQEPLRMVSSYLQLIEHRNDDALDEESREFLAFAVDGAERMREMVNGLLRYSRVDTQDESFEPVDLDAVFDEIRADLQVKIEERDGEIAVDSLPRVYGDRGQLRQVFQNLLHNALEYSRESPRIRVSAERTGSEWTVSVRDDGIGIPPDDQDRIFEVFQRLHSHEDHAGTGIGLALCKRIVERHGGDITVDSDPGEGSTFSVTLPAIRDSDAVQTE